ncbi:MAG TPA: FAD binding domain-containing protein [Rhodopila sp.]
MLVALRSRRQIAPFALHRPASLAEAVELRSAPGTSAFLAGGIDLIDWLKLGHPIERLIRLDGVAGLDGIAADADTVRIGAMTRHAAIAASPLLHHRLPDLAALWQGVANPRVRFAGTIGGNVMADRSEYDALPALLALNAEAEIAAGAGTERIPLGRLPALAQPLLAGFVISEPDTLRLFADRTLRPAVSVWVGLTVRGERVRTLRVAVGMAHPRPVCVTLPLDIPVAAVESEATSIAAEAARLMPPPASDGRAGAEYRRRMIGVLTQRLLARSGVSL